MMEIGPTSTQATSGRGKAWTIANLGASGGRDWREDKEESEVEGDLHIYRRLDITLSINQRVLIKHDENLYSDLTLNREKQTFRFEILKLLVCCREHFQTVITSSSELQIMCSIYPS
jgi:hypothetical protein